MNTVYYLIMVPMVYLAVAVCLIGVIARLIALGRAPRHPHSLAIFPQRGPRFLGALGDTFGMPTVRRHQPLLWFFLLLYHLAFLVLIASHFDLFPGIRILPADSPHMIGAGAVGVVLTLALFYFLIRRFRSPIREITVPSDYLLLLLLLFLVLTGSTISWANSWNSEAGGFVITKQDFGLYLDGLARFRFEDPREVLYGSHYIVVVLHVLLANLFLILLPFSKIMHTFIALPMNRLRRGA
ncbi:MAG: hypothetical protein GF330_03950 [Candidatus Eisenbacteria bacterium]|nr:hypothetical protein [Candidatus Eisenbacteria bacterium]